MKGFQLISLIVLPIVVSRTQRFESDDDELYCSDALL